MSSKIQLKRVILVMLKMKTILFQAKLLILDLREIILQAPNQMEKHLISI